ncbi:60S ribosomal protein L20 [Gregarina niphandrodes]|uniref:60S ribosomal protein L18a n=1 Tax=Gregarina niphandrodes TaxID=110365 RepID=A0A023BA78_GRENI|nr:60S ribosomal protein L20 [Gregarina niphandrodes]EZG78153.1 60S ribosomal protein L20 [Gregarina niphandrodes]|eukprot:XP_011129439.1 60S ribosomal protein L20 [Gregarina niphandrodes]
MVGTIVADKSMQMRLKQFVVSGRALPTEREPEPAVYRMTIFARDSVVAKSRYWYFRKRLHGVKKNRGEILDVEVKPEEETDAVKNYGIWLRYDSRTCTINMYKEFRDITKAGALSQMYSEMAGRHRAQGRSIQVLKIKELTEEEVKRPQILQLLPADLKFPHVKRLPLCNKNRRTKFQARRPTTFHN